VNKFITTDQRKLEKKRRWQQAKFLKWRPGCAGSRILIDAVHAAGPRADARTGVIADVAAARLGAHCIVATTSRTVADLNRPRTAKNAEAIDEYRSVIHRLLESAKVLDGGGKIRHPFLHIAVHGMRDNVRCDIEIGTRHGQTCSQDVSDLVRDQLTSWAQGLEVTRVPTVVVNQHFIGDSSKTVHRLGDSMSGYQGYGHRFNIVQIEFASWLRRREGLLVAHALIAIGRRFLGTIKSTANG
jgi:hypothetical protein